MHSGDYNQQYLCALAKSYLKDMSGYEFSQWKLEGFSYEFLSNRSKRSNDDDS